MQNNITGNFSVNPERKSTSAVDAASTAAGTAGGCPATRPKLKPDVAGFEAPKENPPLSLVSPN
jgi:hypothetical protein